MTTSTTSAEPEAPEHAEPAPTLAFLPVAIGPAIAALVLWAASVHYTDRPLAGLLYALCLGLYLAGGVAAWGARRHALAGAGERVLSLCALVTLAYAALPLPLVAAAAAILAADALRLALGEPAQGPWKTTLEKTGIAAFFAFQGAALLLAPQGVTVGLDWAARVLLWAAAAFALWSAGQTIARH